MVVTNRAIEPNRPQSRGNLTKKRSSRSHERIQSLQSYTSPYVTVGKLTEYWQVTRKQIYKQINAGTLKAIKLGPRLLRIRTVDAIEFERLAGMIGPNDVRTCESSPLVAGEVQRRRL